MLMNTVSVAKTRCNTRLTMPIFGLPRKIHDTVNKIPGMISGTSVSAKNSALNGVSVRSLIQASKVPSEKASTALPRANCSELARSRAVSALA